MTDLSRRRFLSLASLSAVGLSIQVIDQKTALAQAAVPFSFWRRGEILSTGLVHQLYAMAATLQPTSAQANQLYAMAATLQPTSAQANQVYAMVACLH
jgi:hypothetical protein